MKRKFYVIFTSILLVLLLAACGSSSEAPSQDGTKDGAQEQTEINEGDTAEAVEENTAISEASSQGEVEDEAEASTETAEVHPYAWLGFEDMPQCKYLDALASNHYIQKSKRYLSGFPVVKETYAEDGVNSYKEDDSGITYVIDGKVTVINEDSKTYIETDTGSIGEAAQEYLESYKKNGENYKGRMLHDKGKEAVPILSEEEDKTEYEYYEYNYPEMEEEGGTPMIERYYFKDGDVYAIYEKVIWGDTALEETQVIKSISQDIPDGTFELPDLSDYEKTEY